MSSDRFAARMKAVSRAITESAVCSPSARKKTDRLSTGDKSMAKLEKGTFDGEEENGCDRKNANLNSCERASRSRRDVVTGAELLDEMNDEFLNEIGAVGNACDESRAGNFGAAKRQTRTNRAD